MIEKLHYNTAAPMLVKVLKQLMSAKEFSEFRLVGGTALSLQRGHRESVAIDLFTDAEYGSINFKAINNFLRKKYKYIDTSSYKEVSAGRSYFVGESKNECIKLDIYYTDKFIQPAIEIDKIRMATVEEIIVMKLDIILRGGRKKDFWDIHELMNDFSLKKMVALHEARHPYSHNKKELKKQLTEFAIADEDFDPICLRSKYWEVIKLDMIDFSKP